MSYVIKPSIEMQFTKAPLIAIAGPTGCGKTESAMRLARGYVGKEGKFCVIDTEEKRALYKRERYQPWDWMDFQPPFAPQNYIEALEAAKSYQAVILDSGSHEWFGDGGCHDIQAEDLERMSKGDARAMERLTAPAWKRAKTMHKKLVSYIIRYPVLLIICLRAEPKVKFVKVLKDGKERTEIVDAGYQPICEKQFMYEMLVGCMMYPDKAGVPEHVKKLEPDLEPIFPIDKQIDEQCGARLLQWSKARSRDICVTLASVQNAIAKMTDKPSRDAAKALCEQLTGEDQDAAILAYNARLAELKRGPVTPPTPNPHQEFIDDMGPV